MNVIANLAGPLLGLLVLVAIELPLPGQVWFLGGLAAATADTVASDIGALARRTRASLPPFEEVPAGRNGAISLLGTALGLVGAALVGLAGFLAGWLEALGIAWVVLAGGLGSAFDSLLGSTVERTPEHPDRLLSKHVVNLLATVAGSLLLLVLVQ